MPSQPPFSLLIADELTLPREALAHLCESTGRFAVWAQAGDGEAAWKALTERPPALALVELSLPRLYALEITSRARDARLPTRIGVLTVRQDRKTSLEILRAGASGIFLKSDPAASVLDGLDRMAGGEIYISPGIDPQLLFQSDGHKNPADPIQSLSGREYQVFSLLVEGIRAKEIAARLNLSPKTVDTYRAGLMRKLDIHDVAGLVKFALQRQLTR
jgi:DNA-binding NarL/FixJ family response regulator